jgi:anti-sigma regulatory factor (Ser/Thr protein kinase)
MFELRRWPLEEGDVAGAMRARRAFKEFLLGLAGRSSDVAGAELIFGELAANGVEHGRGSTTLVLWRDGEELTLSVQRGDNWLLPDAAGEAPSPSQTRGRGLFFIRSIARRIDIATSGAPTRIVLPVALR